jgi:ATP-dependent Lhr-like helicase
LPQPTLDSRPSTLDPAEQWAWQLLRRWGVVFRDLLAREPGAPPWYELCRIYRRLEARGEIRGGRFITGVAGEQFALGETVRQLRQLRDEGPANELVVLSAADPLNLIGIITPQARVPAKASNRIALCDGALVAAVTAGEFVSETDFERLDPAQQQGLRLKLGLRGPRSPQQPELSPNEILACSREAANVS